MIPALKIEDYQLSFVALVIAVGFTRHRLPNNTTSSINPVIAIALLALIGLIIFLLWRNSRNTEGIDPMLLQAVKGNKPLAKRLLEQAKFKYPGKSDRWYVEKIIYDLERDRAGSRGRSSNYINPREARENIYLIGAFLGLVAYMSSFVNSLFRGKY